MFYSIYYYKRVHYQLSLVIRIHHPLVKWGDISLVEKVRVSWQRRGVTSTVFPLHSDLSFRGFLLSIRQVEVRFSALVPTSGTNPFKAGKNSGFLGGFAHVMIPVNVAIISANVWETLWIMDSTQGKATGPQQSLNYCSFKLWKPVITCASQNPAALSPGAKYIFQVSPGQRQGEHPH